MKMTLEKPTDSPGQPKALRPAGSRAGRKRGLSARTKDFWRVLSDAALAAPHTPVLRRFHD